MTSDTKIYEAEDRLPLSQKFWYGFMEIPVTLLEAIFMISYFNFFFYNQLANKELLGASGAQLGIKLWYIGIFLYTVIDALNDFYFGRWSDRKKEGRYGRRASLIKIFGPIWAIFSVFIWFPWWPAFGANPWVIFVHFLFSMVMFDNLMTIVMINWMALRGEITDSTRERNKLELSISMSGVVSGIIAFLFIEELEVGTNKFYFATIAVAIVSAIMFWVIAGKIRKSERPELYKEQRDVGLIESIKIVGKSRTFVVTGIIGFVGMAAVHLGMITLFLLPVRTENGNLT